MTSEDMRRPTPPAGRDLLAGKVVLVTAAAGTGIGNATARRCLEEFRERYIGPDTVRSDSPVANTIPEDAPCQLVGLHRQETIENFALRDVGALAADGGAAPDERASLDTDPWAIAAAAYAGVHELAVDDGTATKEP